MSIFTMIWGITMFGYILGGLASMLTNSDAMRARYKHRLLTIKDHLVSARIGRVTFIELLDCGELQTMHCNLSHYSAIYTRQG